MIIIGYQGIGKSTYSNKDVTCIDLESGNFCLVIYSLHSIRIH